MTVCYETRRAPLLVRTTLAAALFLGSVASATAAEAPALTDNDKTFYAIGVSVARSLDVFNLSPSEFETVKKGIEDAHTGRNSEFNALSYNVRIQELAKERRKATGKKQAGAGKAYLEQAAHEKGAVKTASGMVFNSQVEGKGGSPGKTDVVKVNYRGTLVDGREFDSSYRRNRPLEFKLDNVIPCWSEGLQMMKPGGKAKLVCPPELAYGDSGAGEMILPGATLVFDVELLEMHPATQPAAPAATQAPSATK